MREVSDAAHQVLQRQLRVTDAMLGHAALAGSADPLRLFAAVTFSILTEPGDEFAGLVRQALGCAEALALLVTHARASVWLAAIENSGWGEAASLRFSNLPATLSDSLARWRPRLMMSTVMQALDDSWRLSIKLIDSAHEDWPAQLGDLGLATPSMLWVRGDTGVLRRTARSWAVVGCRTPTEYGFEVTSELVAALADSRYAVVSGGAFGIDAIAHEAALHCNAPTVAVMAGGVDRLYPRSNESLLRRIIASGAVISEVPIGVSPTKWRFLQRNRIIAALSNGTVIVEAGFRSGAINTAHHAGTLTRPVMAVPGSILSAKSAGCNKLIADGKALIVNRPRDLIELIDDGAATFDIIGDELTPIEVRVLDAIGFGEASVQQICISGGLTSGEAASAIGALMLKARVFQKPNGYSQSLS